LLWAFYVGHGGGISARAAEPDATPKRYDRSRKGKGDRWQFRECKLKLITQEPSEGPRNIPIYPMWHLTFLINP
jgi:hypothetical protein